MKHVYNILFRRETPLAVHVSGCQMECDDEEDHVALSYSVAASAMSVRIGDSITVTHIEREE